jgi:hypothetical protein
VESRGGEAGGVGNFNCVTAPPNGDRDAFPGDASLTGGVVCAFLSGDTVATDGCVVARMTTI